MRHRLMWLRWCTHAAFLICFLLAGSASGYTAAEIIGTATDNYEAVSDFTATLDASTTGFEVTSTTYRWARGATYPEKSKWVDGCKVLVTDGSHQWNYIEDPSEGEYAGSYWNTTDGTNLEAAIQSQTAAHLLWPEKVLATHTWQLEAGTYSVQSVECYKLTTSGYVAYIDTATRKKVVRIEEYNGSAMIWQLTFSEFSTVENTAVLAQHILAERFLEGLSDYCMTYEFTDISINDNLSASTFYVIVPTAP